jgi:hypothetical protein
MPSLSLTSAFRRYGATLTNPQWAVSAINSDGELVVSCWRHYLKGKQGKLFYVDRLSRWAGNTAGNNLLREHLERAIEENLPVRLVEVIDSGADASQVSKSFGVREDLIGRVVRFDGDQFEFEFTRAD